MSIQELTQHPELMNRETLYELRRITAEHPYYQTARLLLLKNLYLLHDSTFDEELRRSAIYITDRRVLFNLVEAAHYRLKKKSPQSFTNRPDRRAAELEDDSRTVSLIDTFLSTVPEEEELKKEKKEEHRKPTAVDATTDYVAYLLSTDFEELENENGNDNGDDNGNQTDNLIDAFINNEEKITLHEELEYTPEQEEEEDNEEITADEFLTETLAGIYIKQKRYEKALNIMERVNEKAPSQNKYYEDQKRFLELIIANTK